MRVNSNKKIHKMKRDPYKTLLRAAGILAIVVVVGIGVFNLCSLAVTNDYVSTRRRIESDTAAAELEMPPKELEVLFYLASHPNMVFTREQLLEREWGFAFFGDSRTVDVHIKRLREKLEGVSDKWCLKTVWGVGYKFEVKE